MRHILIALTLCGMLAACQPSQNASLVVNQPKDRAIELSLELMEITETSQQIDMMIEMTMQQLIALEIKKEPKLKPFFEATLARFLEIFKEHKGEMLQDMAALYAHEFTERELEEMIAFYQSPTGKKMVAKMPKLMQAGQVISERMFRRMKPQFFEELEKIVRQTRSQKGT